MSMRMTCSGRGVALRAAHLGRERTQEVAARVQAGGLVEHHERLALRLLGALLADELRRHGRRTGEHRHLPHVANDDVDRVEVLIGGGERDHDVRDDLEELEELDQRRGAPCT